MRLIPNFELKFKARAALKDNWQIALMVALIASLPSLASQVVAIMTQSSTVQTLNSLMSTMQQNATVNDVMLLLEESGITAGKYMPSVLVGIISALLSPFLTLGMLYYFFKLLRGEEDALIGTVFSRKECFFKAIGLNLMIFVRTFLWRLPGLAMEILALVLLPVLYDSAFFIITLLMYAGPLAMMILGIRATLHYAMATRFMAETPSMGINQCIRESVNMMRHRKMLLFSLEVSFMLLHLGITLLETLLLGMFGPVLASTLSMALSFTLNVYVQMAVSAFYLAYRQPSAI